MTRQHWPSTVRPAKGQIVLLHGLSSIADSWWQVGAALAEDGWDVTAVDQAGHGSRPVDGPVTPQSLAAAVREVVDGPEVLIGHSMGTFTALALLEDDPHWAGRVILEEPGSVVDRPGIAQGIATSITVGHALVQNDRPTLTGRVRAGCPDWDDHDVHWAVEGIAQMRPEPFADWFSEAEGNRPRFRLAERVLALDPLPYVLAARSPRSFNEGGSALVDPDRTLLQQHLPPGHFISIDGGHCLHRDAPEQWLAAVRHIVKDQALASDEEPAA